MSSESESPNDRYKIEYVPASILRRGAQLVGRVLMSFEGAVDPGPMLGKAVIVELEGSKAAVAEHPADGNIDEMRADLERMGLAQFEAKWL